MTGSKHGPATEVQQETTETEVTELSATKDPHSVSVGNTRRVRAPAAIPARAAPYALPSRCLPCHSINATAEVSLILLKHRKQVHDSNVLILTSPGDAARDDNSGAEPALEASARKLSKSEMRKARKAAEAQTLRYSRAATLATIAEAALPADRLALLRSAALRGQRETKRQYLRRALQVSAGGRLVESVRPGDLAVHVHSPQYRGLLGCRASMSVRVTCTVVASSLAHRHVVLRSLSGWASRTRATSGAASGRGFCSGAQPRQPAGRTVTLDLT